MSRTSGPSLDNELPTAAQKTHSSALPDRNRLLLRRTALLSAAALLLCLTRCGSNIEEVLFQTAAAAGQTYVDLLLTDVANDLADAWEDDADDRGEDDAANGDDADDDDDEGANTDGGDGGPALDGAALFADNCSACHGEDGASGFAPDISGTTAAGLTAGLELTTHAAISLSAEEIAAIAEFLGGTTGGAPTGDPAAGELLFTGSGCGACHCPDAAGGCALDAPSLIDKDLDALEGHLVGEADHAGGKFDLTADDLADLHAYLAGLD